MKHHTGTSHWNLKFEPHTWTPALNVRRLYQGTCSRASALWHSLLNFDWVRTCYKTPTICKMPTVLIECFWMETFKWRVRTVFGFRVAHPKFEFGTLKKCPFYNQNDPSTANFTVTALFIMLIDCLLLPTAAENVPVLQCGRTVSKAFLLLSSRETFYTGPIFVRSSGL